MKDYKAIVTVNGEQFSCVADAWCHQYRSRHHADGHVVLGRVSGYCTQCGAQLATMYDSTNLTNVYIGVYRVLIEEEPW